MGKRKGKSVRKNPVNKESLEPENLVKAPHSFVIHRGQCTKELMDLTKDFRKIMEPFTASQLKVSSNIILVIRYYIVSFLSLPFDEVMCRITSIKYISILFLCYFCTMLWIKFQERKKNTIKDFVSISGYLHVSHMMIFTETELGTYMRLARLPRGPTLTFRIHNVSKSLVEIMIRFNTRPWDSLFLVIWW